MVLGKCLKPKCLNQSITKITLAYDWQSKRHFTPDQLSSYKRGAGGRSSFNGVVATLFGGTGQLGQTVINTLGKEGTQTIMAHRSDSTWVSRYRMYGDLGQVLFCYYQPNDINEEAIYKSMKYSNVAINLIGAFVETNNYTLEETNINIPRKLARIAKECGVKRFIHISHLGASADPPGPSLLPPYKQGSRILRTKAAGELAVREEFPDATILRPATMFGFGDRFFNLYGSRWRHTGASGVLLPLWALGERTIKSPVYMWDVARAINALACRMPLEAVRARTFQLTGPYAYSLAELCDWMHQVMHREPEFTGYERIELSPTFWMKVKLPRFKFNAPKVVTPETVEYEFVNEEPDPDLPNFRDMGLTHPVEISDQGSFCLQRYKSDATFDRVAAPIDMDDMLPPVEYPPPRPLYKI